MNTIKSIKCDLDRGRMEMIGVMQDGTEEHLFGYYTDELSFSDEDFIGLTVEDARKHYHAIDVAYLQSQLTYRVYLMGKPY